MHSAFVCGLALLLLLLLPACAATTMSASPPVATTFTGVPDPNAKVTLVLWHGWSGGEAQVLGQMVERFNRQHPASQVILQAVSLATFDRDLRQRIASGNGPHMVLIPNSWVGSLVEAGALLPLDEWVVPAEQQLLLPTTLAGARADGSGGEPHLYGLPISFDALALYYNTANILIPPSDTDELIRQAHGLSAPDAAPPRWGFALDLSLDTTIGYFYAAGGRVLDNDGALVLGSAGRTGAETWLRWLLALKDDKQLFSRGDSSIPVDREINDGRVLMTFDWAHQLRFYRRLWSERLGVAPLPRLSETNQPPQPYVRSDVLAISAGMGANVQQAALAFLRFMISEEVQRAFLKNDIQPARSDLQLDSGELDQVQVMAAQTFHSQAEQGRPMPNDSRRERVLVHRELARMQWQVLMGDSSPADAVTETDQRLREQLGLPTP